MKKTICVVLLVLGFFVNSFSVMGRVMGSPIAKKSLKAERKTSNDDGKQQAKENQQDCVPPDQAGNPKTEPCAICNIPCRDKALVYTIDARPGYSDAIVPLGKTQVKEQRVSYSKRDEVHVFIKNMNPFLYDYTIKVDKQEVAEAALFAFLKAFSPFLGDVVPSGDAAATEATKVAGAQERFTAALKNLQSSGEGFDHCPPNAQAMLSGWEARLRLLKRQISEDSEQYQLYFVLYDKVVKGYKAAGRILSDPLVECKSLCEAATEFETVYDSHPLPNDNTLLDLKDSIAVRQSEAEHILQEIEKFQSKNPECLTDILAQIHDLAKSYVDQTKLSNASLDRLRKNLCKQRPAFAALKDNIDRIFSHSEILLRQEIQIGKYGQPTNVTITIASKPRSDSPAQSDCADDPAPAPARPATAQQALNEPSDASLEVQNRTGFRFAPVAYMVQDKPQKKEGDATTKDGNTPPPSSDNQKTAKLSFGKPIFSISGGIAFAFMDNPQYDTVQGIPVDRSGNPTMDDMVTGVVGLTDNSKKRIGPILLLNARLFEIRNFGGIHFSTGITGKKDKGVDIEYLIGPSVSIFENKVFLTFGAYIGKVQTLGDNLFVGAKVDNNFKDKAIGLKQYSTKFGFSVSYKIK